MRPQFGQAECRRVVEVSRGDRALRLRDHRRRGRKIRLADLHVDDRAAGRFQRAGSRLHLHHVERRDIGDAGGKLDW